MLSALAAACFAGFVGLVLLVPAAERWWPARRPAAVRALIAYAVAASGAVGLLQRDAWPFAKWPMAGGRADAWASNTRLLAVDVAGAERPIDARAWQPLGFDQLTPWMHLTFPRLARGEQEQVAAHLLAVAEHARRRARDGHAVGTFGRFLGPLAAPEFDLHPHPWGGGRVPPLPFVALRVYRESWSQEERRRDPTHVERRLVFEYRAP